MTQLADDVRGRTVSAAAFSFRIVLALIFVSVLSFSAFVALSAFAPELASGDNGRGHALSRSAIGYAAIVRLAHAQGRLVAVSRQVRSSSSADLVVFTPESPPNRDQIYDRGGAAVLIVLPKWMVAPSATHRGWVMKGGPAPIEMLAPFLNEIVPDLHINQDKGGVRPTLQFSNAERGLSAGASMRSGRIDSLQTISGKRLAPVITDADGRMIMARFVDKENEDAIPTYILADPDFLNTAGVADRDTARVAIAMLDLLHREGGSVAFDVTLNGFERSQGVLRTALSPPFLAATLCVLFAAGLMAWRAITIAQPKAHSERAIALGKRALADNAAALLRLSGRDRRMGWNYAQLIAGQVAEKLRLPRKDVNELITTLDGMGARLNIAPPFSDIVAEANAAETPIQMLAAARALHIWKEEMLRATR